MSPVPICEKFVSIQGEGEYQGFITTFIRVAGCNLRCPYCDTKHAHEIDDNNKEGFIEIKKWIQEQWPRYICFTGGEPLLYNDIVKLANFFAFHRYKICIETNGTIDLESVKRNLNLESLRNIMFTMDFKHHSIEMTEIERLTMYKNLGHISAYDEVKFVVPYSEIWWALETIDQYNIRNPVISPIITDCTTQTDLQQFTDYFITMAQKLNLSGVRFQTQLHKQIWGNRKGV